MPRFEHSTFGVAFAVGIKNLLAVYMWRVSGIYKLFLLPLVSLSKPQPELSCEGLYVLKHLF